MQRVKRNVIITSRGDGRVNYKLSLTNKMIEVLGVTGEDRIIDVIVMDDKIILVKDFDKNFIGSPKLEDKGE